jgi:hypothetical protein
VIVTIISQLLWFTLIVRKSAGTSLLGLKEEVEFCLTTVTVLPAYDENGIIIRTRQIIRINFFFFIFLKFVANI